MSCANGTTQLMFFGSCYSGVAYFDSFNNTAGQGRISASNANWTGYVSANRTATNNTKIYRAKSSISHAQLATGTGSGGTLPTATLYAFASNEASRQYSSRRFSYFAIHDGLTIDQSAAQYGAVQRFRQRIGGGYV
jgi:hypothetical protein